MMVMLHHGTKISASRHDVYTSLTDLTKMAAWHGGKLEGRIEPGQVLTLHPKPDTHFSWVTEKLEMDKCIVQKSLEETDSIAGKTLIFTLSDLNDGRTLVELTHGDWSESDPHLPFCNTYWGEVLFHLKTFNEQD